MLACCSNICEKRFQCARYNTPAGEIYCAEDLYSFGSGSLSSEGCIGNYWCGEYGNYKMFIPMDLDVRC